MAIFYQTTIQNGSAGNDFMFGAPGTGPNHTISGNGGDDVIYGDYDYFLQGALPNGVALTDDPGPWNQILSPDTFDYTNTVAGDGSHLAVVIQKPLNDFTVKYKINVSAQSILTLDVDFGGADSHSNVKLYAADGTTVLASNFGADPSEGGLGSVSSSDAYLEYYFATAGTYYISAQITNNNPATNLVDMIFNIGIHDQTPTNDTPQKGDNVLSGGDGNDTIFAGQGSDKLFGGAGNDILVGSWGGLYTFDGGRGNDIFHIRSSFDELAERPGEGFDTVRAYTNYNLKAGVEVEVLEGLNVGNVRLGGNEFGQSIYGGAGRNYINGGGGADSLYGKGGDDTYLVDQMGDRVYEDAGGGDDAVYASSSFALTAGSHIERLLAANTASSVFMTLTGNEFAQTIEGNTGNNILDGKGGADRMIGHGGQDLFYVDNAGDYVDGDGVVKTSVSWVMWPAAHSPGTHVHRLETVDAAAITAIDLTGNELKQTLTGNAGANVLDGAGGVDIMRGGAGNDTYRVDFLDEVIVESINAGYDTVLTSTSYTLRAAVYVERFETTNAAGTMAINLTGNEFNNVMIGNAGANILNGAYGADTINAMGGNDRLNGSFGNDRLAGGAGNDGFGFNADLNAATNVDTIIDFANAAGNNDYFRLAHQIFASITGPLETAISANQFVANANGTAQDADDRIVYNTTSGALFYDSNGNAAGGAVQFAIVGTGAHPTLTAADFFLA